MYKVIILPAFFLLLLLASLQVAAVDCGDHVDLADSLDFEKMHADCGQETNGDTVNDDKVANPVIRWLSNSLSVNNGDNAKAENHGVKSESVSSDGEKSVQASDRSGLISGESANNVYTLRQKFTLSEGLGPAKKNLLIQMSSTCPKGWEKLREWSVFDNSSYFLHYQIKCLQA